MKYGVEESTPNFNPIGAGVGVDSKSPKNQTFYQNFGIWHIP